MSYTGNPQDLPGLFAALEERVRALENRTVSVAGGTLPHNHMGSGTDSTVVAGLLDSIAPTAPGQGAFAGGEGAIANGKASVAIGGKADLSSAPDAEGDYITVVGGGAIGVDNAQVVIGAAARGSFESGSDNSAQTVLGTGALAGVLGGAAHHAIAIGGENLPASGTQTQANRVESIAIGHSAHSDHAQAVVLGANAVSTNSHQIQLGTAAERTIMGVPNSAIASADLTNGQISFYLDETGNTLTVKAKYSTGAVKTGTVALV